MKKIKKELFLLSHPFFLNKENFIKNKDFIDYKTKIKH
jgi:hypothetical protein